MKAFKMAYWKRFSEAGINSGRSLPEVRSIMLSNKISIIIFVLSVFLFTSYAFAFPWDLITTSIPIIGATSLVPLILNSLGFTTASRMFLSMHLPVSCLALSVISKVLFIEIQDSEYYEFRFIMLSAAVLPVLVFTLHEHVALFISLVVNFFLLMSFDAFHNWFNVGYYQTGQQDRTYYFVNMIILVTYTILTGAILFLKRMSEKNESISLSLINELNEAKEILQSKNSEIEARNQEILTQSEILNENQKRLVSAYEIIQQQKDLLDSENKTLTAELLTKNKELTDTNTELIKHNNELRQFSFTVSHNMRGPVASLLGLLNLLQESTLDPTHKEIFQHIKKSAHGIDTIIRDLGKIIDIRHDIFRVRQKVNLHEIVNEIMLLLRKEIKNQQVKISVDFNRCSEIYSVKPMVHSILFNLISNGIKYRSTERTPEITVTSQALGDHYTLEVTDNGLGIDLKKYDKDVFKLYKRFHSHTEGKGLGLYLVKLQCESLGGRVNLESEMNRYTSFKVTLPKVPDVQKQILFDEPYAQIFYDAMLNVTGVIWRGPLTGQQYRSVFVKCLDFLKAYNTPNWISDISHQGNIYEDDQLWMFTNILPSAASNGLKRIAFVKPGVVAEVAQTYIANLQKILTELNFNIIFLSSMEDALDWIQTENEKLIKEKLNLSDDEV